MWNCICNGALKGDQTVAEDEFIADVFWHLSAVDSLGLLQASSMDAWGDIGPADTGQFRTGWQIRVEESSFLC
jgi:hypothetical protein